MIAQEASSSKLQYSMVTLSQAPKETPAPACSHQCQAMTFGGEEMGVVMPPMLLLGPETEREREREEREKRERKRREGETREERERETRERERETRESESARETDERERDERER